MWNDIANTESASGLLPYAIAYAAMLVLPGPSFMIVSQASLSASRREAALVAAGVASGAGLLTLLLLHGAASLPASDVWEEGGRVAGTLLLLILGFRTLRRALRPALPASLVSGMRPQGSHFVLGLLTALTNPISFSFFSSVALTSHAARTGLNGAILPVGVFVMALLWFGLLALLLSRPAMRSAYGRSTRPLDGIMGTVLVGLALSWLLGPAG